MKLAYKITKYLLIALFILSFVFICCFIYIVKTEQGSRFLLTHIPNLTVEEPKGSLSGGWSAKKMLWQNDAIEVTVDQPAFTWYASCLLKANICIDNLSINQVAINLINSSNQSSTPSTNDEAIILPSLSSPVNIEIKQLSLNEFSFNNETIIENIKLNQMALRKNTASFNKLSANYTNLAKTELTGSISFIDDWPLQLSGQINLEQLLKKPWTIHLSVSGGLQKQLALTLDSQGYVKGFAEAKAKVLDEKLPAQLNLTIQDVDPKALADLPETFAIKQLNLKAEGTLQAGYQLQTHAVLAGQTQPVELALSGLITTYGIHLQPLTLSCTDQHFISLEGQFNWSPALTAHAKIHFQAFPWLQLYPLDSPPPVVLENLQADLDYRQDQYQASLSAKLTGPAGPFALATELQGDLTAVTLSKLLINTPDKGTLQGRAEITFNPSLSWLADIDLQSINPNYWLPEITGKLQGNIHSEGNLYNNQLSTQTKIAIDGTVRQQKALIKAQILANHQQWQVPQLLIQLGNNQVKGQGQLDKQLQAELDLNLPSLQHVLPDLAGSLKGQVKLAGSLDKPIANINLVGQRLALQQQRIATMQLNAVLNQQQQGQLNLQANRITSNDTLLGNLLIHGYGNLFEQKIQLQLTEGIVKLLTNISSLKNKQNNWDISVDTLTIHSQGQQWQLNKAAQLHYTTMGRLTLDEHCLKNGQASLCSIGQQKLLPQTEIHYQLAQFPLESLAPWLPDGFSWQGILSAEVNLKLPKQGPIGQFNINASNGSFKLNDSADQQWHSFPYQDLYLTSDLTPDKVDSQLKFAGGSLGNVNITTQLNPKNLNKPLTGDIKIAGFDVNILQPFIPELEQLTGKINGFAHIKGTLTKPYASGKITLTDGNAVGDIPISIEGLQATAMIEGESLKLTGDWRSGASGSGKMKGALDWSNDLDVNLSVQTNKLPIIVAPYAELEAATDLQLKMQKNALLLTGNVQIPKGKITVRDIPPSTVKISSDAVIIKDQASVKQNTPLLLNMDIDVIIGGERLKFSGFGLTSDITGKLKVANNLLTHGQLNLKDGQFRAYGQRLEIRRARIIFAGSLTEPTLDIEAVRVVDDVTAGLRITGLTSQPKVTIFSTPAMSQDQALSYIIMGRPMGAGDSNMLAKAALVLGVTGGAPIVGDIADKIGIQDFQLDTAGSGDKTSVVASGNITDKLSVHYGFNIFQAVNNIMVRYKLTKTVYLEAATGVASSLDLFYKKSF